MARSPSSIGSQLGLARRALAGSDTPALDAQVLLAHALGCEPAWLFAHDERRLSERQLAEFRAAWRRRAAGEPIAYITGRKGFYDIELRVTPKTLIPRPETELLLEEALRLTAESPAGAFADIGTGSGALALAFARQRPRWTACATDICGEALDLARLNGRRLGVDVAFCRGDLARPLLKRGIQVDLLLANLPYVASADLQRLAVARHEPHLALDGGADGLDLIRRLLKQIPALCLPGAWVLLEIGADQGAAVRQIVAESLGVACHILQDYARLDRIARFQV